MAVADFLVGAVSMPLTITLDVLLLRKDLGHKICEIAFSNQLVLYAAVCSSLYHLTVIAWERYIAVTRWMQYNVIIRRDRVKKMARKTSLLAGSQSKDVSDDPRDPQCLDLDVATENVFQPTLTRERRNDKKKMSRRRKTLHSRNAVDPSKDSSCSKRCTSSISVVQEQKNSRWKLNMGGSLLSGVVKQTGDLT